MESVKLSSNNSTQKKLIYNEINQLLTQVTTEIHTESTQVNLIGYALSIVKFHLLYTPDDFPQLINGNSKLMYTPSTTFKLKGNKNFLHFVMFNIKISFCHTETLKLRLFSYKYKTYLAVIQKNFSVWITFKLNRHQKDGNKVLSGEPNI